MCHSLTKKKVKEATESKFDFDWNLKLAHESQDGDFGLPYLEIESFSMLGELTISFSEPFITYENWDQIDVEKLRFEVLPVEYQTEEELAF